VSGGGVAMGVLDFGETSLGAACHEP